MKQSIFILLFLTHLLGRADAQLIAKVNPGGLITGLGSASIECFASKRISGQLDGFFIRPTENNGISFAGAGAGVSARYYVTSKERPAGFFISPAVAEHWISFKDIRSIDHNYQYTALGGQIGYQAAHRKIITFEVAGGLWTGLNVPTIVQAFGVKNYYGEGLNWWLSIGLGLIIWSK
jgi:hypothetical protein